MGLTNFQHCLRKKYGALTGELIEVQSQIDRIRHEQAKLPALEGRAAELNALITAATLLLNDAGGWQPDQTPPVRPWTHAIPIPYGSCGRRAMNILRLSDKPMTVREIALEVLRQAGVDHPDRETAQRTHNAVHATLKARRGRSVEASGKYPAQWRCLVNQGIEFDD
jgi:hypothetical protein